MDTYNNLIKRCFTTISVEEYVREYNNAELFLSLCEQCLQFGKRWCCPPFSFNPLNKISDFKYAHIFGAQIFFHPDAIEQSRIERNGEIISRKAVEDFCAAEHSKLLEMREKHAPAIAFGVGCSLCSQPCAREIGKACRHSSEMLHSLESFGFDISATASKLLGIELLWAADGILPKYSTVVTALFSNDKIIEH